MPVVGVLLDLDVLVPDLQHGADAEAGGGRDAEQHVRVVGTPARGRGDRGAGGHRRGRTLGAFLAIGNDALLAEADPRAARRDP